MNSYIFLLFLTHFLYGAFDSTVTTFNLVFPDRNIVSHNWNRNDFKKIRTLNYAKEDLGILTEFTYQVPEDKTYLSHKYFQNLVTGNFVNESITRYINDYNFFIGSEAEIRLPYNKQYEPFPTSLQWKVFKDNEDFFRISLKDGAESLQNTLKMFLYYDYRLKGLSINVHDEDTEGFSQETVAMFGTQINLSTIKNETMLKFSIKSPYEIDYKIFESLNEETRKKTTWLNLNNCFLFDLNLSTLFQYFPNLHKLSIKNSFIKTITNEDIDQLEKICEHNVVPAKDVNSFLRNIDKERLAKYYELGLLKYSAYRPKEKILQKIEFYLEETSFYSFVLDLHGCQIQKNYFESVENNQPKRIYKKTILIKGIKTTNNPSLVFRLFSTKHFIEFLIISAINYYIIKTFFTKTTSKILRICIGIYTLLSFVAECYLFKLFCNKFYFIHKKIVFEE